MDDYTLIPTNSMNSIGLDALTVDGIEDPLINVNQLATMDYHESYFAKTVDFLSAYNEQFNASKIKLYKAIKESTNTTMVLESFSDFFVRAQAIIGKFLDFAKTNIFDKNIALINSIVAEDAAMFKDQQKLFAQFTDKDAFTVEGFVYTLVEELPAVEPALSYNGSIFASLYGNIEGNLGIESISNATASIDMESENELFRGRVLGRTGERVRITEFGDELFKLFRNGKANCEMLTIDKAALNESYNVYTNQVDKYGAIINRQFARLERGYESLSKEIEDLVKRNGDLNCHALLNAMPEDAGMVRVDNKEITGMCMSPEMMTHIDLFTKAKVDQIEGFTNIHALAFSAEMDAIRDSVLQDKNILHTALGKLMP